MILSSSTSIINSSISLEGNNLWILKSSPIKFEAGTPPIAEVIGLREAI